MKSRWLMFAAAVLCAGAVCAASVYSIGKAGEPAGKTAVPETEFLYMAEHSVSAEAQFLENVFSERICLTFDAGLRAEPDPDCPVSCIVPAYADTYIVCRDGEWTCLLYGESEGWIKTSDMYSPPKSEAISVTGYETDDLVSGALQDASEPENEETGEPYTVEDIPDTSYPDNNDAGSDNNSGISSSVPEPSAPVTNQQGSGGSAAVPETQAPQTELPESESVDLISIKLDVPHYLQGDARWAGETIGSSSYTIGKVGCALSCIAMSDSYRTGTVITPLTVAKTYAFSPDADIYWPAGYSIVTGTSDYLQIAYDALLSGKPVVFGCKKASGTQHWVVIVGYEGTLPLKASDFIINDPASSSRRTLDAYMASYPYFYKLLYYSS